MPPIIESGALIAALAGRVKLRENEAEAAERRDEGGDDGGAENGNARHVAAVGAGLRVAAAARHVAAMPPKKCPAQHADQSEHQTHHQTDRVDNHKPSLSCCWSE